ncbi:MAG: hypothetical protein A4E56_00161 [Pelotomaculum sp. PtaU1.Bin065]|nr:MAG: hypothetical protein A4E56_00161 [Pelotomaculum sp. PtaU1.Bin065]
MSKPAKIIKTTKQITFEEMAKVVMCLDCKKRVAGCEPLCIIYVNDDGHYDKRFYEEDYKYKVKVKAECRVKEPEAPKTKFKTSPKRRVKHDRVK